MMQRTDRISSRPFTQLTVTITLSFTALPPSDVVLVELLYTVHRIHIQDGTHTRHPPSEEFSKTNIFLAIRQIKISQANQFGFFSHLASQKYTYINTSASPRIIR